MSLPCSFARRARGCVRRRSDSRRAESVPGFRLALDPFSDSVDAVILWFGSGYGFAVRVQSAAEAELAVLAFEEADSRLEVVQQRGSPRPERAARLLTERVTVLDEHIAQMRDSLEQGRNQGAKRIWMLAHEHRLATLTTERDYIASVVHDIESKELTWPTSH